MDYFQPQDVKSRLIHRTVNTIWISTTWLPRWYVMRASGEWDPGFDTVMASDGQAQDQSAEVRWLFGEPEIQKLEKSGRKVAEF